MLRNIIEIDEELCDGCGECVSSCAEGALQIIDGKAKMVSELYCDGLGACISNCPQDAIKVIQRECEPYDEIKTLQNIMPQGNSVLIAHLRHLYSNGQTGYFNTAVAYLNQKGIIPDFSAITNIEAGKQTKPAVKESPKVQESSSAVSNFPQQSELDNWPIQLHLVNPMSGAISGADLLISADCVPFALRDFHGTLLKDKAVLIACPKLDSNKDAYVAKLTMMFKENKPASVTVAIMEVPCCGGLVHLVKRAIEDAGTDIPFSYRIIGLEGKFLN